MKTIIYNNNNKYHYQQQYKNKKRIRYFKQIKTGHKYHCQILKKNHLFIVILYTTFFSKYSSFLQGHYNDNDETNENGLDNNDMRW